MANPPPPGSPFRFATPGTNRVHHTVPIPVPPPPPQEPIPSQNNHEAEKAALVVGLTAVGLIYLYFFKK